MKLKIAPKDLRNLQKPKPMGEKDRRLMKLWAKRDQAFSRSVKGLTNIHSSDDPAPLLQRDETLRKSIREVDLGQQRR